MLLYGAARAAVADRVADRPVLLGDVLLHHHDRLGRQHVVRVGAVVVERSRGHHVAAAQRRVVEDRVGVGRRLEAVRRGARAEHPQQLPVPALLRRPGAAGERRIAERDQLVDAAVHRAAFHAHDAFHRVAAVVGEVGDVGARRRRGEVVGHEAGIRPGQGEGAGAALLRLRLVEVGELARRVALFVDRVGVEPAHARSGHGREVGAGHADEHLAPVLRRADPGLHLRPGEHRAAARMVGDVQRGVGLAPSMVALFGGELVSALGEAAQQADQAALARIVVELRGDVPAVQAQLELLRFQVPRELHLHQRVPAADEVGAIGECPDLDAIGLRCRRCACPHREHEPRSAIDRSPHDLLLLLSFSR